MKIKILKNKESLEERAKIHSKMSTKYILSNKLDPAKGGSIFEKKLIFYDLETNGFGEKAYVHQIAALEFNIQSILEDYLSGKPITGLRNLTASGGIVTKARFDSKDFEKQDKIIRNRRQEVWNSFKRKTKDTDLISHKMFMKLFADKSGGPNMRLDPKTGDSDVIVGALLTISEETRIKNSKLFSNLLSIHMNKRNPTKFDPVTQSLLDSCGAMEMDEQGKLISYKIFNPSEMFQSREDSNEEQVEFFANLCDLFRTFSSSPYHYTKSKGPNNFRISENFKKGSEIIHYLKYVFAFTYTENKNFTEYEKFPLEKYKPLHPQRFAPGEMSEEQGIRSFLQYLKSLGKDNYILVGHNIKSFDNNVIMKRAAKYNISRSLVAFFQNSEYLDSLDLLTMYSKQMEFFANLLPELESINDEEALKLASRSKQSIDKIVLMHKKLKSKLDGLMKIFDETEDSTQTHTADDDCEKLAQVLVRAIMDMYEMNSTFERLDQNMEFEITTTTRPFTSLEKFTNSKIRDAVFSKISGDLEQGGLPIPAMATFISNDTNESKAIEKTVKKFGIDSIKSKTREMRQNSRETIASEDVLSYFLELNTNEVISMYEKWQEKQLPTLFSMDDLTQPQVSDDNIDPELDPEISDEKGKFNESLIKRWSRAIK